MTDNELLTAISDMLDKKLSKELQPIKDDLANVKDDLADVKDDLSKVKNDLTSVRLHIENVTDRNISLLAENHMTLINKLNQAIKVSDKTTMYEIQVNILSSKVEKLELELEKIKNKIA